MNRIDNLIAKHTGFRDMEDMLNAGGNYRPSCDVSQPVMREIADAYDAEQEERGDPRRAYRYGELPKLKVGNGGWVFVNQGKRFADVVATTDEYALIEYEMPNGRNYFWQVPITTAMHQLREEGWGNIVRNVSQNKPPMRWRDFFNARNNDRVAS